MPASISVNNACFFLDASRRMEDIRFGRKQSHEVAWAWGAPWMLHIHDDWVSVAARHTEQKREVVHGHRARLQKAQWKDSCCLLRLDRFLHVEVLMVLVILRSERKGADAQFDTFRSLSCKFHTLFCDPFLSKLDSQSPFGNKLLLWRGRLSKQQI